MSMSSFKFLQVLIYLHLLCNTEVIGDKYQFHELGNVIVDSGYIHLGFETDISEMDQIIAATEDTIKRIENDNLIANGESYDNELKKILQTQIETMKTMLKEVKEKYNEIKFLLSTAQMRQKRFLATLGAMAIGSIVGFIANGLWLCLRWTSSVFKHEFYLHS